MQNSVCHAIFKVLFVLSKAKFFEQKNARTKKILENRVAD